MIDVVVPEANEEKLVEMAENLGFGSLCFLYDRADNAGLDKIRGMAGKTKLKLYAAGFSDGDVVFGDVSKHNIGNLTENRKIDVLFGFESIKARDRLNQRSSGLDHVLCKLASERKKIYCVDFGRILSLDRKKRALVFGRLKQNIMLCRKYRIEIAIASFASLPLKMRNYSDMSGFLAVLGHDTGKKPLEVIGGRIMLNKKKKSGRIIREGIEVL